jgi:hypothetical protein
MSQLTYDLCLLYTDNRLDNRSVFGIVGLQTDDILILADTIFIAKEAAKLKEAQFTSKDIETLTRSYLVKFNSGNIKIQDDRSITFT